MPSALPELTSIAASLDELVQRLADIAEQQNRDGDSSIATELYEVERSLNAGRRRLSKVVH